MSDDKEIISSKELVKDSKEFKDIKYTNISNEELRDLLNTTKPINIKNMKNLIDRVHEKYPVLDKTSISLIVKAFFESFRDLLVMGYSINLSKLKMKLYFYKNKKNTKEKVALKIKMKSNLVK